MCDICYKERLCQYNTYYGRAGRVVREPCTSDRRNFKRGIAENGFEKSND